MNRLLVVVGEEGNIKLDANLEIKNCLQGE